MITRLPLLCVFAGSTLLTGCLLAPADKTASAATVQPSVQTTQKPTAPAAKVAATATPKTVSHPTKTSKAHAKPPAPAAKKPPAKKPATRQTAAVKTIKPGSASAAKVGQKLSPEEVEDLIRKLSVCRPS